MMMKNNGGKLTKKIQTKSDTFLGSQKISCLMCRQFDVKGNVSFFCVLRNATGKKEMMTRNDCGKLTRKIQKELGTHLQIKSELHVLYAFDINRNGCVT